eukprot:5740609-Prymnesium_polylepis.2
MYASGEPDDEGSKGGKAASIETTYVPPLLLSIEHPISSGTLLTAKLKHLQRSESPPERWYATPDGELTKVRPVGGSVSASEEESNCDESDGPATAGASVDGGDGGEGGRDSGGGEGGGDGGEGLSLIHI